MHSYVALLLHWIFIEERDLEKLVKPTEEKAPILCFEGGLPAARSPAAAANGCLQAPDAAALAAPTPVSCTGAL